MSASKFTFQYKNKDLKATCAMKSGWTVVHESVDFSSMTFTKQIARSLRLTLCKLLSWVWENSCIYGSKRIARTDKNFGKTAQSTREEIRASFELITRRVSVVTVDVCFTQITGVRRSPFLRTSALSINVSSLDILWKIKVVLKNTDSSFGVLLLLLFYIYSVISASVINIVPFIEAVDKFRNLCLFRYLITVFSSVVCRKLSITCKLHTVLTLLLLTMAPM